MNCDARPFERRVRLVLHPSLCVARPRRRSRHRLDGRRRRVGALAGMTTNRRVILAARPEGFPQESDFALDEVNVPRPGTGEVLVRVSHASIDPYQRGRMSEARSYAKPMRSAT